MANYQGVIAGIGDKENDINVISPNFDASIRNFIVGKDCILHGLSLNGNILTAGACIAQGYCGYLPSDIDVGDMSSGNIYAHFKVNHDDLTNDGFDIVTTIPYGKKDSKRVYANTPLSSGENFLRIDFPQGSILTSKRLDMYVDSFAKSYTEDYGSKGEIPYVHFQVVQNPYYGGGYVIVYFSTNTINATTSLTATYEYMPLSETVYGRQDDILNEAGEYYLLLYQDGVAQTRNNYPERAENSNYTTHIDYGGSIGQGVTVATPDGSNKNHVANVEYVHNEIEKWIGYDEQTIGFYQYKSMANDSPIKIANITIQKKSDFVLCTYQMINSATTQNGAFYLDEIVKESLRPKNENAYILFVYYTSDGQHHQGVINIKKDGTLGYNLGGGAYESLNMGIPYYSGWKI